MNTPVTYRGGISNVETAQTLLVEIGSICHAHLDTFEAMAKLGLANKAFEGLFMINPINMKEQSPLTDNQMSIFQVVMPHFNDRKKRF